MALSNAVNWAEPSLPAVAAGRKMALLYLFLHLQDA